MILSKGHQQIIDIKPVFLWQLFPELAFCLLRGFGRNVSPSVANSVHMGINTDTRFAEAERHHQIGGLAPHPFEFQEFIDIIRNVTGVFRHQPA